MSLWSMTKEEREKEYRHVYRKAYNSTERVRATRREYYIKNREKIINRQKARILKQGDAQHRFRWRTELRPMNGEVVLLMVVGMPVVGKYDTERDVWCRHTDIGFEVIMYQDQVSAWSFIPECGKE